MEDDMAAFARALSGNMQAGEFLKFLKTRPKEERWQLIEGIAVMMNPPTLVHQVIALNLRDLLKEALARKKLDLLVVNECGVRIPSVSHFLPRPDVVVIPGIADYQVYAERFLLAAEVLSPSNTKSLIAQKVRRYKEHADNLYCLVIDSRRAWMQIHARMSDWEPVTLDGPENVVELPEFALRCRVGDLYRQTPLDPGRTAAPGNAPPRTATRRNK
jgi:Uma2 family endonuclease